MATRQEYIALKKELFKRVAHAKKMKVELLSTYLSATYPDIRFKIVEKDNSSNLNVTIEFYDLDVAETSAMSDAVNTYLINLEVEAKNVS
jgi:hypothetical protein